MRSHYMVSPNPPLNRTLNFPGIIGDVPRFPRHLTVVSLLLTTFLAEARENLSPFLKVGALHATSNVNIALGLFSTIRSNERAGPVGRARPCSQLWSVRRSTAMSDELRSI